MPDNCGAIIDELIALRKAKGITQRELAKAANPRSQLLHGLKVSGNPAARHASESCDGPGLQPCFGAGNSIRGFWGICFLHVGWQTSIEDIAKVWYRC